MNLNNCLDGFSINRANLRASFIDSQNYWRELKQRECDACAEIRSRTEGIRDTNRRVEIFKEVANKYGFREQYLMTIIKI